MKSLLLGILLVLFILVIYNTIFYYNVINGIWSSDPNFAQKAEIDDMVLYINPFSNLTYVLMYKDGAIIYNKVVNIKFSTWVMPWVNGILYFTVKSDGKDIFPKKSTAKLNIYKGTLKIYDEKKCYAKLKK